MSPHSSPGQTEVRQGDAPWLLALSKSHHMLTWSLLLEARGRPHPSEPLCWLGCDGVQGGSSDRHGCFWQSWSVDLAGPWDTPSTACTAAPPGRPHHHSPGGSGPEATAGYGICRKPPSLAAIWEEHILVTALAATTQLPLDTPERFLEVGQQLSRNTGSL